MPSPYPRQYLTIVLGCERLQVVELQLSRSSLVGPNAQNDKYRWRRATRDVDRCNAEASPSTRLNKRAICQELCRILFASRETQVECRKYMFRSADD